ncbi:MAG TPA: S41 family peptidase [Vicinamibacterales bacterium]|jgi:carboxyl-terminal processing protease|nr:S41 family peptidase [Vicinamibacterales bacterium]
MTSRTRLWVLLISTPVIVFAIIGGYLGQVMAKDDTYQHLRVFEDVVSLVLNNYVEEVDVKKAMRGAMNGLADNLDADSGFLPANVASAYETNAPVAPADIGVELSRQYYLRVISVRDGSPAAKAGLRSGDFIRAIDKRSTKDISIFEGDRLLHGQPGSKVSLLIIRGNAADPHEIDLNRERIPATELTSKMADATTGYIHIVEFSRRAPVQVKQAVDALAKTGAARYIIDLRGATRGDLDDGVAAARLFVKTGTLVVRETKTNKETVAAQNGDGAITAPVVLLVDQSTARAGEVFAAALDGNKRAEMIGEHTIGSAAKQKLVKLPDGSAMLLSYMRYAAPNGNAIHEKGLQPEVPVDEPDVEFGTPAPTTDPTLQKALEYFSQKKAA